VHHKQHGGGRGRKDHMRGRPARPGRKRTECCALCSFHQPSKHPIVTHRHPHAPHCFVLLGTIKIAKPSANEAASALADAVLAVPCAPMPLPVLLPPPKWPRRRLSTSAVRVLVTSTPSVT
jgi:hypothetical protein